jgi:hypothetical protein
MSSSESGDKLKQVALAAIHANKGSKKRRNKTERQLKLALKFMPKLLLMLPPY